MIIYYNEWPFIRDRSLFKCQGGGLKSRGGGSCEFPRG